MIRYEQSLLGETSIPALWTITQGGETELGSVVSWFVEHRELLREACDVHGGVVVRGFRAIDSAKSFAVVLESIAPELMDYVGGSAPRTVAHGRVFNATALAGNFSLPLHQEMAYQDYRPDTLALFCQQAPAEGGETTVADARIVTNRIDPGVLARCAPHLFVERALPRNRVENRTRPWCDVFETEDRAEVERIAAEKGWTCRFRADHSLLLRQRVTTLRTHAKTGARVWANQLHYHMPEGMLAWALRDGRADDVAHYKQMMAAAPEDMDHVFHSDGTPVSSSEVEHVWDVLRECEVPVVWQTGDLMFLDNVLAMHGRRPFTGPRSVLVGMIRERDAA